MPESVNQQFFDKIVNLLLAINCLYEEVIEMNFLPENVRNDFLEWYEVAVDFLREQRDILIIILNRDRLIPLL